MTYQELYSAFVKRYQHKLSKPAIQEKTNLCWKTLKSAHKGKKLGEEVKKRVQELQVGATTVRSSLLNFFTQSSLTNIESEPSPVESPPSPKENLPSQVESVIEGASVQIDDSPIKQGCKRARRIKNSSDEEEETSVTRSYSTPAQDAIKAKIHVLNNKINAATEARDSGIGGPSAQREIEKLRKALKNEESNLKKHEPKSQRMRKYRQNLKENTLKAISVSPEVAGILKTPSEQLRRIHVASTRYSASSWMMICRRG
ncbi:Hypothetical predicted protein [Olea europaea subsp. europaea]|uniref:Uncharacterized protein n=1 Tax=Olea europaea subsp. europaea TaxID=158383 RepID=A0A8S0RDH1_OLEEU|nr:Hypothetical predicted protein [Olea europaea subsp. europaea]